MIEDRHGLREGVAVKLYDPEKMQNDQLEIANFERRFRSETSRKAFFEHRGWMTAEYEILAEDQVEELKKQWG